jgi:hypothetical protein
MGNHWKIIPKISIYTNLLQDDYPIITHVIYIYMYSYVIICVYVYRYIYIIYICIMILKSWSR